MDLATLNALTRRWQLDELGLDQEANVARINARRAKQDLTRTNKKDVERQASLFADRGLAKSGIATKSNMDLQQGFNRATSDVGIQKGLTLSDVARRRLQAKSAYDQARAQLALGTGVPEA